MNTSTQKEQKAVRAAASVKVPNPPKSPTTMITGSINSHFASHNADAASRSENGSRTTSFFTPMYTPTAATQLTISSSGNNAPVKSLGSGVWEYTQYRIAGTLVGNSRPSDPEEVSNPMEKFSG